MLVNALRNLVHSLSSANKFSYHPKLPHAQSRDHLNTLISIHNECLIEIHTQTCDTSPHFRNQRHLLPENCRPRNSIIWHNPSSENLPIISHNPNQPRREQKPRIAQPLVQPTPLTQEQPSTPLPPPRS